MRVVARLFAVALALVGVYWVAANAWFFFSWWPTMAAFDSDPTPSLSDKVFALVLYGGVPGVLAIAVSVWIWRATRRSRRAAPGPRPNFAKPST